MNQDATVRPTFETVICDVLGELAFMVSDDQSLEPPAGASWLEAEIRYVGPVQAIVRCCCTTSFARQLTANLLGLDAAECGDEDARDGLREFMNVLCGQLVTAWHGSEAVFNLSIPDVKTNADTAATRGSDSSTCVLSVAGEPLYFSHTNL